MASDLPTRLRATGLRTAAEAADRIEALEAALRRQMEKHSVLSLEYQDAARALLEYGRKQSGNY